MIEFPKKLQQKLDDRKANNALRQLPEPLHHIDFSSNDYLGFAHNETIYAASFQLLLQKGISHNGATGSRLLSGNHGLFAEFEQRLCAFHKAESALVFNSGYDANIGFFSTVPQRDDVVFYDEFIHASIRDGVQMGRAKSYKFKHNDLDDLKRTIERAKAKTGVDECYVVTEAVFSMDGDSPDLRALADYCTTEKVKLIIDEAHAIGVLGKKGVGLVQELKIEHQVFARILTFGKALGAHGAAILGSKALQSFLLNFARSFIYTTGLSPHSVATLLAAYAHLQSDAGGAQHLLLTGVIQSFKKTVKTLGLEEYFIVSNSAVQSCVVPGNAKVKQIAKKLADQGFSAKAILAPTVEEGKERLRFCLHSFNTQEEIGWMLGVLKKQLLK